MKAVLDDPGAGERARSGGLAFAPHHQDEVLAAVLEVETNLFLGRKHRLDFYFLGDRRQ